MSSVASPVTVLINRLAAGPTAPAADGPPLLTRGADVVARMGPGPGRAVSSRTSATW